MLTVWLQFLTCGLIIAVAGTQLSRYGDVIADKTGLSGNWIGLILLASVTSLPELITGVSSVTLAKAPDIAVGNILGSCMVNLLMLVLIDCLYRKEPFYRNLSGVHILSASLLVIMLSITGASILLKEAVRLPSIGHVGFYSILIFFVYGYAVRAIIAHEKSQPEVPAASHDRYPKLSLRSAVVRYIVAAFVVIAAGVWLPVVAVELATVMNWHGSFVGTLFVAGATTLPELAVTVAAVRIGALDMAVANLLGSNMFNITILGIDDIFYLDGPLMLAVTSTHAISAFTALCMAGLGLAGFTLKPESRISNGITWISLGMVAVYIFNAYVLFSQGHSI